jgi:hypothetical protein
VVRDEKATRSVRGDLHGADATRIQGSRTS